MPWFFVQEHQARRQHWDLRLEAGGVLKSWALPKGPPLEPGTRRLAIATPDHPLDYGPFEGVIPAGHYGAGRVTLWDRGLYHCFWPGAEEGLRRGRLGLDLYGSRLRGRYALVRMETGRPGSWLLIKQAEAGAEGGERARPRAHLQHP